MVLVTECYRELANNISRPADGILLAGRQSDLPLQGRLQMEFAVPPVPLDSRSNDEASIGQRDAVA